jgi:hypothetical protein
MASTSAPLSAPTADLPPNFTSATDPETGKTYYINKTDNTTSFTHPKHTYLHEPYTSGVPYPHERKIDEKGRAYYLDREAKSSSWLHPAKLAELKAKGVLDKDDGGDGERWREWILKEVAEDGPDKGEPYWVDYKTGEVDWQSPEEKRVSREKAEARRAARQ